MLNSCPQPFYRWKNRLQAESELCQGPSGGRHWPGTLVFCHPTPNLGPQACCVTTARLHALSELPWDQVVSGSSPASCFASLATSWVLRSSQPPSVKQKVISVFTERTDESEGWSVRGLMQRPSQLRHSCVP